MRTRFFFVLALLLGVLALQAPAARSGAVVHVRDTTPVVKVRTEGREEAARRAPAVDGATACYQAGPPRGGRRKRGSREKKCFGQAQDRAGGRGVSPAGEGIVIGTPSTRTGGGRETDRTGGKSGPRTAHRARPRSPLRRR